MRFALTAGLIELLLPIQIQGSTPQFLTSVTQDSRLVEPGGLYVARPGNKTNGLEFVNSAAARGAALLLTAEPLPANLPLPAIRVKEFHPAFVTASHYITDDPSRKLDLIGITGTNGKTSTAHLVRSIFESSGSKCAMLTTIGYWTGAQLLEASLTTPDIDRTCTLLSKAVSNGCQYGVMEVSSHALDQGRVDRLRFRATGFSNLTQDHLDYHQTMESYFEAKLKLFQRQSPSDVAIINISQSWGAKAARGAWGLVVTVGKEGSGADLTVANLEHTARGARYRLRWLGEAFEVGTHLVGDYQGENIALAAAIGLSMGLDLDTVKRGVESLKAVPGRMEAVDGGQPFAVLVDYSHTPDALERALASLRSLTAGRLIAIFGCGGDRDKAKRPLMGRIAAQNADFVYITSDNPRTENPSEICTEILAGVPTELRSNVKVIVDRREATFEAIASAKEGDVALLAGKGSESYLEVNGVRTPYDDRLVALEALSHAGYQRSEAAI